MGQGYLVKQIRTSLLNFINYVYFVIDEETREMAVIDPSWNMAKIDSLVKEIDGKLTTVLLTHSHYDHTNLVNRLLKKYRPQVFMSGREIDFYGFKCGNLNKIAEGEVVKLGRTQIDTLLTPGHTNGSTCYHLPKHLFTGDTVFIEGCGKCDPRGGSASELFRSLGTIKENISPRVAVFPSHSFGKKPGYELGHLLRENIYFQIEREDLFVQFRMRKNQKGLFRFK